jgi:hypothetical protein
MGAAYHKAPGMGYPAPMAPPVGKGIYARGRTLYPNGDPAAYARAMECAFCVFLDTTADAYIQRAPELGMKGYLYALPEHWVPGKWPATLAKLIHKVWELDLEGLVADPEFGWVGHDREAEELGAALREATHVVSSVGITSYPSWGQLDIIASVVQGSSVWGSPQLYGILEPAPNAALNRRGDKWRRVIESIPSLGAWARNPAEQAEYLRTFTNERGAILWQSTTGTGGRIIPEIGTESFEVLRRWQPRGAVRSTDDGLPLWVSRLLRPLRVRRA